MQEIYIIDRGKQLMNIKNITNQYYANWFGIEPTQMKEYGVILTFSQERDKTQKGYAQAFDLYIWITNALIVVSYGSKFKYNIKQIINKIKPEMKTDQISSLIMSEYGTNSNQGIKFIFENQKATEQKARKLKIADYPLYHNFFLESNPSCRNVDWLQEYFIEMVERELCYGINVGDKLACVNDLPSMPYMENCVQEIGINTLAEFRGKGYAKVVCATCVSEMLNKNICPQWSTAQGNTASERLAYSVGFQKLAETITVSL